MESFPGLHALPFTGLVKWQVTKTALTRQKEKERELGASGPNFPNEATYDR